jgi:2-polyprenyl-3-methyl-5-hydroxy-6-metoxy-1,4-benzoquinol methylase
MRAGDGTAERRSSPPSRVRAHMGTVSCPTLPEARYDGVADFYEGSNPDCYASSPNVGLLALIGDVRDQRVLDLACGHGRISRELARRGARVTGLDLSGALLDRARAIEQQAPLGIAYVHKDVASSRGSLRRGVRRRGLSFRTL